MGSGWLRLSGGRIALRSLISISVSSIRTAACYSTARETSVDLSKAILKHPSVGSSHDNAQTLR